MHHHGTGLVADNDLFLSRVDRDRARVFCSNDISRDEPPRHVLVDPEPVPLRRDDVRVAIIINVDDRDRVEATVDGMALAKRGTHRGTSLRWLGNGARISGRFATSYEVLIRVRRRAWRQLAEEPRVRDERIRRLAGARLETEVVHRKAPAIAERLVEELAGRAPALESVRADRGVRIQ